MKTKMLLLFLTVLIVGIGAFQYYLSQSSVSSYPNVIVPSPTTGQPVFGEDNSTTLIGDSVCLPHKNTSGAQTMECAFGLQTHPDLFYALDLSKVNNGIGVETGRKIRVTGLLKLVEELNTDQWQQYNIKGIIAVDKLEYEEGAN